MKELLCCYFKNTLWYVLWVLIINSDALLISLTKNRITAKIGIARANGFVDCKKVRWDESEESE